MDMIISSGPTDDDPTKQVCLFMRERHSQNKHTWKKTEKVLGNQTQRFKSTTTISIKKQMAAIDAGRRIDLRASFPTPARLQQEGTHKNPRGSVASPEVLAKSRLARRANEWTDEQATTTRTTPENVCFTEVMTKVRGSERSGLDMGKAADGSSDAPMDMVMEMATAVTSIAAETAGEDTPELMERNDNGKRRRRSEVRRTPGPSVTEGAAWSARLNSKPAN